MAKSNNVLLTGEYVEKDDVYITPKGRGNFVFLHEKFKGKQSKGEPKYVVSMILPADADLSMLDAAAVAVAKANGVKIDTFLNGDVKVKDPKTKKVTEYHSPFIAADEKLGEVTSKGEPVDLEGWKMLRCSSKRKPKVRNNKGVEIDEDDVETEAYSGRWLRLMVRPYWFDVDNNQGVSFGLEGVQLLSNDDPIGGAGAPVSGDAFSAVDDEDDDELGV